MSSKVKEKIEECFVIMPISDCDGYEKGHFRKVFEDVIKIACEKAGFVAIRADDVKKTNLIHIDILEKLISSPMAICDLSSRNPNVLFELGLRQAFDKPTVLIQDTDTPQIFDITPLRFESYRRELKYREVIEDQDKISNFLIETREATKEGKGFNSLINLLSISNPATLKEIDKNDTTQLLQILLSEFSSLKNELRHPQRIRLGSERRRDKDSVEYFEEAINMINELYKMKRNKVQPSLIKEYAYDIERFIIDKLNFSGSSWKSKSGQLLEQVDYILTTMNNENQE